MILEIFPSGPIATNAILIGCPQTKRAAVIDAPLKSCQQILAAQQRHGLHVEMILLTHSHWDHIAEVALFKKEFGAHVLIHAEDAGNLERPGSDGLTSLFPITGVKPDGYLVDGQQLFVGNLDIEVIHTPGHSPGCVCFYLEREKILISGDTLFRGGMGNLTLPTARPQLMKESFKKLARLPSDVKVIPGHGKPTTIGAEQIDLLCN